MLARLFTIAIAMFLAAASAANAEQKLTVGNAKVVVKTVTGTVEAELRQLQLQDDVYHNELIQTAANAATEIVFLDDTKLALGPNSRLTLDKFVYDPNPEKAAFVITAAQGALRFVSGKLPKASYTIHTPTATIGIRGTMLTIDMMPADPNGESGDAVAVKVAVQEGIAYVTTCRGEQITLDNHSAAATILGTPSGDCAKATGASAQLPN